MTNAFSPCRPSRGQQQRVGVGTKNRYRQSKEKRTSAPKLKPRWNDNLFIAKEHVFSNKLINLSENHSERKCFVVKKNFDGLASFTERADGSPQLITYKKRIKDAKNCSFPSNIYIHRSTSPMDLQRVTKALLEDANVESSNKELDGTRSKTKIDCPSPIEVERITEMMLTSLNLEVAEEVDECLNSFISDINTEIIKDGDRVAQINGFP